MTLLNFKVLKNCCIFLYSVHKQHIPLDTYYLIIPYNKQKPFLRVFSNETQRDPLTCGRRKININNYNSQLGINVYKNIKSKNVFYTIIEAIEEENVTQRNTKSVYFVTVMKKYLFYIHKTSKQRYHENFSAHRPTRNFTTYYIVRHDEPNQKK